MTLKKVKNIIFDLGGVVINLNVEKTFQNFATIANSSVEEIQQIVMGSSFFEAYEKGTISSAQFRQDIRNLLKMNLSDADLDKAWNGMLLDIPVERLQLMQELSQRYNLFVLSNTNEIHIQEFHQRIDQVFGITAFRQMFDKIYYSFEINRKKPDAEIFQYVLDDSSLRPEETLFLEDTLENIHGASSVNIITYTVQRNQLNLDYLKNELLS